MVPGTAPARDLNRGQNGSRLQPSQVERTGCSELNEVRGLRNLRDRRRTYEVLQGLHIPVCFFWNIRISFWAWFDPNYLRLKIGRCLVVWN